MTWQSFSLIPFSDQDTLDLEINGQVSRRSNTFYIQYVLVGNLETVVLPAWRVAPSRRDQLWKTTCFEFFIAIKHKPQYWEFNISPSGDWNVYVMDAYRQVGMKKETRIKRLPFEIQKELKSLSLELTINLDLIIERKMTMEVGIATVIQRLNRQVTYWALVHPRPEADFHVREGFVLEF
ncbi:MAG TPA: DOMON-like domain-containing protein [Anaerolineales bacterium]|nr:DOMON-like domain-containing protein [Anaerolineales bacterium]